MLTASSAGRIRRYSLPGLSEDTGQWEEQAPSHLFAAPSWRVGGNPDQQPRLKHRKRHQAGDGEAQAGVFALELADLFLLFSQLHFLLGQVLLGLLQHLRCAENFHDLHLLGVPVPSNRRPCPVDAALQMLGVGVGHIETLTRRK
jgi:hypothetical protein